MFEPIYEQPEPQARIKIIGVGGGGCNAVNHLAETSDVPDGVELFAVNTDAQALRAISGQNVQTMQIGASLTKGLG